MENIMIFARIEKKYLLNQTEYEHLMKAINTYIQLDQYGKHTICNLYFDNEQDELARFNFQKPVYKEKLRLRSYGIPSKNSTVFLEMKKKYEGVVYKRRIALPIEKVDDFLEGKIGETQQIEKELHYFINFYKPTPKLYLAYERRAYYGLDDASLRLTFDENIRSRQDHLFLESGDQGELLFKEPIYLLEIKTQTAFPTWLIHALNELGIYPASFSKYNNVYKQRYFEGGINYVR